ncbi:MAG: AAA family ATPase, partial [Myxococcota bacterium]|nr:AAA family ATPase [Myxococcota bacterium]
MNALPVCRASELEIRPEDRRWLIEGLWADEAVGILGGEPKCCKSFLALDLAVAVAAGVPALRHFPPARTGPVLLFAAEDALHVVRRRLEGIALAAGADFDALEVHVITTPVVRLDLRDDRHKLRETVERLRPTLLVLDPFVRMHRVDENTAADVAPILAWLRELQRKLHTAVLVVHHSRKGAAHARAGQALRGSSELHAWGDSNLYVRRRGQQLLLTVEHRAAPSDDDLAIELSA